MAHIGALFPAVQTPTTLTCHIPVYPTSKFLTVPVFVIPTIRFVFQTKFVGTFMIQFSHIHKRSSKHSLVNSRKRKAIYNDFDCNQVLSHCTQNAPHWELHIITHFSKIYYHITFHNPAIKEATAPLNWQIHIEAMLALMVIQT